MKDLTPLQASSANLKVRNLELPGNQWIAFEVQAQAEGKTLSEWAGNCMLEHIPSPVKDVIKATGAR